ncbi:MAG: hypothetical protein AAF740_03560, partial [Bacteroidota bacterium]
MLSLTESFSYIGFTGLFILLNGLIGHFILWYFRHPVKCAITGILARVSVGLSVLVVLYALVITGGKSFFLACIPIFIYLIWYLNTVGLKEKLSRPSFTEISFLKSYDLLYLVAALFGIIGVRIWVMYSSDEGVLIGSFFTP